MKRWSEREGQAHSKVGLFDGKGPGAYEMLADKQPMLSSFTKDGVFLDGPLGKGLNEFERIPVIQSKHKTV